MTETSKLSKFLQAAQAFAKKTPEEIAPALKNEEYLVRQATLMAKLKKGRKTSTVGEAELRRICDIPISSDMTEQEFEDFNRKIVDANQFESGWRLFGPQARALQDFYKYGGLFAPIGVGHGKTLITLKCADRAYQEGARKILLLIPPEVFAQLTKRDIPWARQYVSLGVPFHPLGRKSRKAREAMVSSNRPGCYILPYSLLSTTDTDFLLESIAPELLICDEGHMIKNPRAARTRRLTRYIESAHPQLVVLSGTITNKGIQDYHHLIRGCLGEMCPLPRSPIMAAEWGGVINSEVDVVSFAQTKPLLPLLNWARAKYPEMKFPENVPGFRRAYKRRLVSTPGVVATSDEEIRAGLLISNTPVVKYAEAQGFDRLHELMEAVQNDFVTPNGDEIEFHMLSFKWLYELTTGFYNELTWPEPEALARKRDGLVSEASIDLQRAQAHHFAQQDYIKELRGFLYDNPPSGLDTPLLVGSNISRNFGRDVGDTLSDLWYKAHNMKWDGMPERESNTIRVCDYKIQAAVKWAQALPALTGGIIWCHHQEAAKWVREALQEAGLQPLFCPAGYAGGERISDVDNAGRICVASMPAHGQGKNLQHFEHQLFLQWPRPAKTAEQTIGRLHRKGQMADIVQTTCLLTLPWDDIMFAATLNDAIYVTQTTGLRQRLIRASYNPLPKIFSPEFLRERGMENKVLDQEQRQMFQDRFGEQA